MKNHVPGTGNLSLKTMLAAHYGKYLGRRRFLSYTIFLLKVGNACVEVWYNTLKHCITNITIEDKPVALLPYLQAINFNELDELLRASAISKELE